MHRPSPGRGFSVSDIAQHIAVSQRVQIEDLDWELARKHGLSATEVESLQFFADIESQTVYYFLEVAKLQVVRDPELLTFLLLWFFVVFFFLFVFSCFLLVCG